ncbi:MAG: tetratricopeptide repeat protein [Thaumarchaeota archaeon]|nr:tetratricopeptide repeat protein [Nitrososphaerota archaeon]
MISLGSIAITPIFAETQNMTTLLQNGRAALIKHEFEAGLSFYDQALKIDPNNKAALDNKGVALGNLDRFDEALSYFDKVLKIDPNHIDALNNKGAALIKLGKFDEALSYFDKVLKIDSNNLIALSNKKVALNHGNVYGTQVGKRFSISAQVEIRNSDGHLIAYLEPEYLYVPDPDFLDVALDTTDTGRTFENGNYLDIEKSTWKINGTNYQKFKIQQSFTYGDRPTVVSKTGFEQGGQWVIYAYHSGYQIQSGDKLMSLWTIIRTTR